MRSETQELSEDQPAETGNLGLVSSDSPSPDSELSFKAPFHESSHLIKQDSNALPMKGELGVTVSAIEPPIEERYAFALPIQDSKLDPNSLSWSSDSGRIRAPVHTKQPKSCCANKPRITPQQSSVVDVLSISGTQNPDNNNFTELFPSHDYDLPDLLPNLPFEYPTSPQQYTGQDWRSQNQQTTVYNIPPGYATAEEPLRPSQLSLPQYDLNSFSTHVPMPPCGTTESTVPSIGSTVPFTLAHVCNCGDSCSCLACPVHPYNATTRNHVQDLGQIIANDYNRLSVQQQSRNSITQNSTTAKNDIYDPVFAFGGSLPSPETREFYDSLSPTTQHFDHSRLFDNPLPNIAPPPFESDDYYTMEFPLLQEDTEGGCRELSGACQCLPNECTCDGCLTHSSSESLMLERPESILTHQDWNTGNALYPSAEPALVSLPMGPPQTSCCGKALL